MAVFGSKLYKCTAGNFVLFPVCILCSLHLHSEAEGALVLRMPQGLLSVYLMLWWFVYYVLTDVYVFTVLWPCNLIDSGFFGCAF